MYCTKQGFGYERNYNGELEWVQRFPVKTFAMLVTFAISVLASYATDFLFAGGHLSRKFDLLRCFPVSAHAADANSSRCALEDAIVVSASTNELTALGVGGGGGARPQLVRKTDSTSTAATAASGAPAALADGADAPLMGNSGGGHSPTQSSLPPIPIRRQPSQPSPARDGHVAK